MKDFIEKHWRGIKESRKGICWGLLWLVVVVSAGCAVYYIFVWLTTGLKETHDLEIAKFKATLIGGGLLAIQLIFFGWRASAADKTAKAMQQTAELTEKGNIAERFKNAIEHLGSSSASIRLGGIYALNHIATDNHGYRKSVFKVLCAHIRIGNPTGAHDPKKVDEIQSIVDLLFKSDGKEIYKGYKAVLSGAYLRGVVWDGVNLRGALLSRANLQGADFTDSDLSGSELQYANLEKAGFIDVNLEKTGLWLANLEETRFQGCNLQRTFLHRANFKKTMFHTSKLQEAVFWNADLQGARFFHTNLQNTNFQEANLLDVEIEKFEEILKAETLHDAKLSDDLKSRIGEIAPKLLDVYTKPMIMPLAVIDK